MRCQVKVKLLRLNKTRHPLSVYSLEKGRQKPIFKLSAWFVLSLLQIVNVRRLWEEAVKSKRHSVSRSKPPFLMVWKLYWALTTEWYYSLSCQSRFRSVVSNDPPRGFRFLKSMNIFRCFISKSCFAFPQSDCIL